VAAKPAGRWQLGKNIENGQKDAYQTTTKINIRRKEFCPPLPKRSQFNRKKGS